MGFRSVYGLEPPLIGKTLSHYEILEEISRGGMGIVYRARDVKLDREVAIKVLPPEMVEDAGRRGRFVKEARTAAALHHPNIATIFDVDETDGVTFIAMELIEGEELRELVRKRSLEQSRALEIAIEIAEGLAVAHEKGIVHRDLKPANVLIASGHPKIIDFGLAKLIQPALESESEEETAVREGTRPGTVLGTFSYMSPEQARGQAVDARSDVFSFGVMLFQMLTGQLPFEGATSADTLSAILTAPTPRVKSLESDRLQAILEKCLAKDARERYPSAKELSVDLRQASETMAKRSSRAPLVAGATVIALALVGVVGWLVPRFLGSPATSSFRLTHPVQVTKALGVEEDPSWSPDGTMLAFSAGKPGVRGAMSSSTRSLDSDIWIVQLGGGDPINRTPEHTGGDRFPTWSPDGRLIAFWSDRDGGGYYLMPALAGPARKLLSVLHPAAQPSGASWSADGSSIACVVYDDDLRPFATIVDTAGTEIESIPLPGEKDRRFHLSWSPDARLFAYVDGGALNDDVNRILVLRRSDGATFPVTDGTSAVWSPTWSSDGRSLYYVASGGSTFDLWEQAMSTDGQPSGPRRALTSGVEIRQSAVFTPGGDKVAYSKGRLIGNLWRFPMVDDRIVDWTDAERLTFENAYIQFFDVSPDETRIAVSSNRSGNFDLWLIPSSGGEWTPLTTDPAHDWAPSFSPDGEEIAFYSYRSGNRDLWVMPRDGGTARQLTTDGQRNQFPDWSPDGSEIVYVSIRGGGRHLWTIPAGGGDSKQLTRGTDPRYSPDGKQVAFDRLDQAGGGIALVSLESNEVESLIRATHYPVWSADGREIYFVENGAARLGAVSLETRNERTVADLSGKPGTLGEYGLGVGREHIYFIWQEDIGDIWVMDVVPDE